jgi:hypothetical protein
MVRERIDRVLEIVARQNVRFRIDFADRPERAEKAGQKPDFAPGPLDDVHVSAA